jgi:hypothetical protein
MESVINGIIKIGSKEEAITKGNRVGSKCLS